jgi:hypothetical protein
MQEIRSLDVAGLVESSFQQVMNLPQQNVQYAMLVRRSVKEGRAVSKPLNTLVLLVAYPIPRAFWSGKPRTIGDLMPTQILRLRSGRGLNWGVGPPGQAAFEGGLPALVLYAFLATFGIRFLDEPLKRQPSNAFLISIMASAAPHVLGWPRGDMFIMSIEAIECFVFAIVVGIGGRMLFGTAPKPALGFANGSSHTYGQPKHHHPQGWQNFRR